MREKLSLLVTFLGLLSAVISAMSMRDHVRMVEIVGLFASGVGSGAGITAALVNRKRAGRAAA